MEKRGGRGEHHDAPDEPACPALHPTQLPVLVLGEVIRMAVSEGQQRAAARLEQSRQHNAHGAVADSTDVSHIRKIKHSDL